MKLSAAKKKGLYKWKPPEETSEVGQLEGALTGEPLVDGSGQVAQGREGPGTPSGVEGQVARLGSLRVGQVSVLWAGLARGREGPSAPSGTKGQVAMLGSLGVLDKCLSGEKVPERGVRSGGKGRMGIGGGDPHLSPLRPDLAGESRGKRAVRKKRERPDTPTRERCERAT